MINIYLLFALVLSLLLILYLISVLLKVRLQLKVIQEVLEDIENGNLNRRVLAGESDITKQICFGINKIAVNSQLRFVQQKQSEQAYKRLMTSLSHDVKTPLASLVGYLEAIESKFVAGKERDEYIRVAFDKSQYLKRFIENLFEWVKLDSGEQIFRFEEYDLNELTRNIIAEWIPILENNHFAYEFDIPETENFANIDLTAYTRILNNLLQNIITHSEGNQMTLRISQHEHHIEISIKDNGKGISSENLSHIFERMYQADHSRSAKGNGLGLSITKELVSAHKGTIIADSILGSGTTFTLLLPKAL